MVRLVFAEQRLLFSFLISLQIHGELLAIKGRVSGTLF